MPNASEMSLIDLWSSFSSGDRPSCSSDHLKLKPQSKAAKTLMAAKGSDILARNCLRPPSSEASTISKNRRKSGRWPDRSTSSCFSPRKMISLLQPDIFCSWTTGSEPFSFSAKVRTYSMVSLLFSDLDSKPSLKFFFPGLDLLTMSAKTPIWYGWTLKSRSAP